MFDSPKRACENCHFFVLVNPPGERDANERRLIVSSENVENAKHGDFSWKPSPAFYLECHLGVWSESRDSGQLSDSNWQRRLTRDRGGWISLFDECYFWERSPTMSLDTAKRLRKRRDDTQKHVLAAVIIAVLGGTVTGLFMLL